jgi:CheY-like chemotaxis protein
VDNQQPINLDERKKHAKPFVLVVDDDPIHHRLLGLLADRLGIMVYLSSSCAEAIESIRMFSFDVILMDCRMPEMDGYICTKRIKELSGRTKKIPIIAVTADIMDDNRKRCMDCGMSDFLTKPFTFEELNEKLCFWLQKKEE